MSVLTGFLLISHADTMIYNDNFVSVTRNDVQEVVSEWLQLTADVVYDVW